MVSGIGMSEKLRKILNINMIPIFCRGFEEGFIDIKEDVVLFYKALKFTKVYKAFKALQSFEGFVCFAVLQGVTEMIIIIIISHKAIQSTKLYNGTNSLKIFKDLISFNGFKASPDLHVSQN